MSLVGHYSSIARATLLIAADNGAINMRRSEQAQRIDLERFLVHQPTEVLDMVEPWLSRLTDAEMDAICAGCMDDPETISIMMGAPPFAEHVLDAYFEEIC